MVSDSRDLDLALCHTPIRSLNLLFLEDLVLQILAVGTYHVRMSGQDSIS